MTEERYVVWLYHRRAYITPYGGWSPLLDEAKIYTSKLDMGEQ